MLKKITQKLLNNCRHLLCDYPLQSDDPATTMGEFSQFVQTTVNEEEHAVHKLLGKQFQVRLYHYCKLDHLLSAKFSDFVVNKLINDSFRLVFASCDSKYCQILRKVIVMIV